MEKLKKRGGAFPCVNYNGSDASLLIAPVVWGLSGPIHSTLLARNAWDAQLGPWPTPPGIFPGANLVDRLALVALSMMERCISAVTLMELCKTRLIAHKSRRYTTYPGPHSEVKDRTRERERAWTWGFIFTEVKVEVPRVSRVHSL